MMVAQKYSSTEHFVKIFQRLNDLRESEETSDICLLVSNKKISAHKIILASMSVFFEKLIYGFFAESGRNELELKEVEYSILSALVDFMYTGQIEITSENVYDMYEAADCYQVNFVKERCLHFLLTNIEIENCVKIWIIAKNCPDDKLEIAARNIIFSNLELVSSTEDFLVLSQEELSGLFVLYPEQELSDSTIDSVLKWATFDDHTREELLVRFLNGIPYTSISEEYLENSLSKNEVFQSNVECNIWLMNIYKDKLKSDNAKLKLGQSELKFARFIYDQPIIFMKHNGNEFYKYNRRDGAFALYNKINDVKYPGSECKTYKNFIYVVGDQTCKRFAFDDLNTDSYESGFSHNHGPKFSSIVMNDSMYLFGGEPDFIQGSCMDLNTKQCTSFSLLHNRSCAGVAVCDGAIYICGGYQTNVVERFDPREGRSNYFGTIPFRGTFSSYYSAAALSNSIYCTASGLYKMMDTRSNSIWVDMESPVRREFARCLVSSHGKLYGLIGNTIYEYNNKFSRWEDLGSFSEMCNIFNATSFE